MSLPVLNPTLYHLSPFHLVLCRCFETMLFVEILP